MKIFKESILLIIGIIIFSVYDFLYNEGTVKFSLILKKNLILAVVGVLILLIIEIYKYFKRKKK